MSAKKIAQCAPLLYKKITLPKSFSLNQLIQMLIDGGAINLRLKQPSITTNKKTSLGLLVSFEQ